ncbi:hypothetical protein N9D23_14360 [Rubripirellula sp.]|nr:hypothetical protein [Rubripirellula sp.]
MDEVRADRMVANAFALDGLALDALNDVLQQQACCKQTYAGPSD